ncbi:MAG: hypothetical protein CSA96_09000 [Bacteroidetes bacterium]|nr:MAG: hypothetical protein CSA96_09000 [Bacteroidota bacterium]
MNFLLHFIFIAAFLLIYIIAIIILKPFRVHRKRPVSTISIKVSYLIYLACFMLMAYLILFFSANAEPSEDMDEERVFNAITVFSVLAFFIPNIGIMIRRRIGNWRVAYNYIATLFNVLFAFGLLWFIKDLPWQFK